MPKSTNRIVNIKVSILNDSIPIVIIRVDLAVQDLQLENQFLQFPCKNLVQ